MSRSPRIRRRVGWGFEGEEHPPSEELLGWLEARLGQPAPLPAPIEPGTLGLSPSRPLPGMPAAVSREPVDRFLHARGEGLSDLIRKRAGALPVLPDAVVRPEDDDAVEGVLEACAAAGVRVVPRGGGTSVTGGVNTPPGQAPVVTLSLERLAGLEGFDAVSGLATFGAGTSGPAVEAALGGAGDRPWTLGHFPQSWELSTLGGWIVTRASGQESLGYGSIQEMVAGIDLVAPAGRLSLPAWPATASGPDLRQVILGSEGRLGVVTRATVRVRPRAERTVVDAHLLADWPSGLEAARALVQAGVPLTLLRLSNEPETEVAMRVGLGSRRWLAPLLGGLLRLRGIARPGCLLLLGTAGSVDHVERTRDRIREVLSRYRVAGLGPGPGRQWLVDRFRHPYLRDGLLDRGFATDTLETAAPWSRLDGLSRRITTALETSLAAEGEAVASLCHVSHPYRDGASLYFTFFFRCPADPEEACARWARIKRTATDAVVGGGGTLSHHHGVGAWHAPWLGREIGEKGRDLLGAAARTLDPAGVLNPTVLLDATDRLES